jgi:membrane carboxypeptidase/penicillin-binding protein
MEEALRDQPIVERAMPPGLSLVKIDPDTGHPTAERADAIFEIFRSGNVGTGSTESSSSSNDETDDLF